MLRDAVGRFGAIAIALICVQIDYFALALALPNMADDLQSTPENLQWAVSAYMIALGIAMVPGSRLGDVLGRKRVVLVGLTIFGSASLWCGLSPDVTSVVVARIVQGIGAGLYFPVSFALVSNATSDAERPRVLGLLSGIAGIGTAAGPILGGAFASTIGWRWVFFVNVPIAAAGVLWGWFQLKEQTDPDLAGKRVRDLDFGGIALIAVLVCGLSLAIDDFATSVGSFWLTVFPAVVGLAALAGFVVWERRSAWPILPPQLWRNQRFTALVIAATIANAGLVVMIFLATLYLQQARGLTGLQAGLLFIPAALGLSIGGPLSGRIAPRIPGQRVMTVAMVVGAVMLAALAVTTNLTIYLLIMGIASLFLGLGFQFGNISVQSVVRLSQAGAAAGVLLTVMVTTGGIAVVAATASIEAFGAGGPDQFAMTVTYMQWALIVGVLGIVFGLWQWRRATLPEAPATTADSPAETVALPGDSPGTVALPDASPRTVALPDDAPRTVSLSDGAPGQVTLADARRRGPADRDADELRLTETKLDLNDTSDQARTDPAGGTRSP